MTSYYAPKGGLPPQTQLMTGRAVFTDAYAFIPRGVFSDIVTSYLPGWEKTRLWLIARPMTGFSETFSQYVMEVAPGGGSDHPENDAGAQSVIFMTEGEIWLSIDGVEYDLGAGGYAYIPAGTKWRLKNAHKTPARFHWVRKLYEPAFGVPAPKAFVTSDADVKPTPDARYQWRMGHHPLCRSDRPVPRHACQYRHLPTRRRYPVRRNPRHGTRAVCAGR